MSLYVFTVPIKTVNPLNGSHRHWTVDASRRKATHRAVALRFPPIDLATVITVTLTRISPGELDDDAVPPSLKTVRDAVAAKLRLDDACRLVAWVYRQERGEASVRVEMDLPTKERA